MALNNFTEQELALPFSMSYAELCKIWDRQQAIKAKGSIRKHDRMKKTLTAKEKLIKWTQLGGVIAYKGIRYTVKDGIGVVFKANGNKIINATFSDFKQEILNTYQTDGKVAIQVLKP